MSYLLRNADFAQTPAKNLVLDRRSAGPDHAVAGQLIFNTTLNEAQVFKNGSWQSIGGSPVPEGETIWHSGNLAKSEFATSGHSHSYLPFYDTRAVTSIPEELPSKALSLEFKSNSAVGSPPVNASTSYAHILNVSGWSSHEGSGGWPAQVSVGDGLAVRQATGATTWGAWRNVLHSGNYTSYAAAASHSHAYVPTSRTVNGKALSANISLTAADVGAAASSHTHAYAPASHTHAYLPTAGGTMTGPLYPQQNTSYTTGQARRIIMSTAAPSGGGNGDVWLRYV